MKLKLKLIFTDHTYYTIGKLYINGEYFCDTLEDPETKVKIMHKTAINKGTYQVIINHSQRFKRLMPLLVNVPNFEGIRIHPGNTAEDTSGCILVGRNTLKGRLTESRETFDKLFEILSTTDENITIRIY